MGTAHARSAPLPYLRFGSIHAVPSLHGRYRFAALVRRAFFALRPQAVAVELPPTLAETIRAGVARLPYLSVVAYDDFDARLEKTTHIVPITPDDSLIEAVRLALSHGVPLHFIDRDILNHRPAPVRAPDDYLVERIGLAAYYERVAATLAEPAPGSPEDLREQEMAARLRDLGAAHERVLFVGGLAHLGPVLAHLRRGTVPIPGAVTQREQKLYALSAASAPQVLEVAYLAYAYELARAGLHPAAFPALRPLPNAKGDELTAAQDAYREAVRALVPRLRAPTTRADAPAWDEALADIVRASNELYTREWNEQPSLARLQTLLRFARNLALVARRLTPGQYHLLLAAKNTVNDDYAFQMYRLLTHYPFVEEPPALPELKLAGDTGEAEGETLTLYLRLPRPQQGEADGEPIELPETPEDGEAGSWQERWEQGERHVSHLPQDARLEALFQHIRERARKLISENQSRSHRLEASLLDGLDLRETLRNLPLGRLYVKEHLPGIGDVGPVVVIFHRRGEDDQYPHERMWFAEHGGESDLALYSTAPGQRFDGPGISRCQYGGVLSLYPPTGRAWVWGNPRYRGARSRAELLLKAAIDLSRKPVVAYVAAEGPSPEMLSLAASRGIHIMYLPLESLSADTLKRVRTFHVLADREIRLLAPDYIN